MHKIATVITLLLSVLSAKAGITDWGIIKMFSEVDTSYIEPTHYRFQTMMQNTYSFETYRIMDRKGNSIRFAPKPSMKVGPYAGFGLIFLGATTDVLHMKGAEDRKEWSLSIYTLPLGIDIHYRKSGNDFKIKDIDLNTATTPTVDIDTKPMHDADFSGFTSSVIGLEAYYIFNHRRFSYPAAINQSTEQKKSAGSAMAGMGYTHHSSTLDWHELSSLAAKKLNIDMSDYFSEDARQEKTTYTDISISGGYGYNWVITRHLLFGASLKMALSYKQTHSNTEISSHLTPRSITDDVKNFDVKNLSLDAVGRFGLVYWNGKWFAGASAIMHTYNYTHNAFYTNNVFGYLNMYIGINLGLKKKYHAH